MSFGIGHRFRNLLLLACCLIAEGAAAQVSPESRTPPGRGHHLIFYDEARSRVLLTGGAATGPRREIVRFDDLWSFDGARWMQLASLGNSAWGGRVAVDAQNRIFAFGGGGDSAIGDLRILEQGRWNKVSTHPSVVGYEPGFVFDAGRNRFLAFGGMTSLGRPAPDVWEFDGIRWSRNPAEPPPARGAQAMVYDTRRGKTVVFGGMTPGPWRTAEFLGDTWEFDGDKWQRIPVAGPPARMGAGAAFDSRRGLMLVFGGSHPGGVLNDLWSWDGIAWKKLAEGGPEPRVLGYLAYDKARDRLVLFGGRPASPDSRDLDDTWEWDGASWRRIR